MIEWKRSDKRPNVVLGRVNGTIVYEYQPYVSGNQYSLYVRTLSAIVRPKDNNEATTTQLAWLDSAEEAKKLAEAHWERVLHKLGLTPVEKPEEPECPE